MAEAFILIKQDPGTGSILEKIRELSGVVQVYPVYGVYDLIVKVQTESMNELKEVVNYEIRRIAGITSTLTMIVE